MGPREAHQESVACGAPPVPTQAFVSAPGIRGGSPQHTGNEMDDLLADLVTSDTPAAPYSMVPSFHCTGCDFQVMQCEDFVWTQGMDYMFFRNNYPTFEKLRRSLLRQQGCLAYCCQCSWRSAHRGASLIDVADGLRWRIVNF